ncbi:MAG: enoyl-CoA hydratase-related protein [Solirubrobacteraceae bacterium]
MVGVEVRKREERVSYIEFSVDGPVGVITLNRPEKGNALTPQFVIDLHEAWKAAAEDDSVRVIVVRANGRHFSTGHDLRMTAEDLPPWKDGISSWYSFEDEAYVNYSRIWRDTPKPSIAAVQGACVAAGLMLCWPCDLIIAADDAYFGDPVARLGIGAGVEYHGHTWELGPRKAKELLFTGGFIDANEAHRLGMVNRVVARDLTQDIQGFYTSVQAVFDQHWVGHGHVFAIRGNPGEGVRGGLTSADGMAEANRSAVAAAKEARS